MTQAERIKSILDTNTSDDVVSRMVPADLETRIAAAIRAEREACLSILRERAAAMRKEAARSPRDTDLCLGFAGCLESVAKAISERGDGNCPVCGGTEFLTFRTLGGPLPYETPAGVCSRCYQAAKLS